MVRKTAWGALHDIEDAADVGMLDATRHHDFAA